MKMIRHAVELRLDAVGGDRLAGALPALAQPIEHLAGELRELRRAANFERGHRSLGDRSCSAG
ncbi:MAG TPA: hypothetical protein VFP89_04640 [Propionibacteriaceae bacterium]|nr:hypothetical protein [Propionibacteriaceae bacterium]